jgi:hypothetical protein
MAFSSWAAVETDSLNVNYHSSKADFELAISQSSLLYKDQEFEEHIQIKKCNKNFIKDLIKEYFVNKDRVLSIAPAKMTTETKLIEDKKEYFVLPNSDFAIFLNNMRFKVSILSRISAQECKKWKK